ncbi:Ankyrin repeat and sterile alpha motif domain-containing protein 1B [Penaeus vannamei]|uniref:Ankyrin repeat and sterile alpha motif domain-containing protein 1B n=1 Tax=Penaeus vannamei TaxID=6689 RepID=A0A3R7MJZ7_PENVA|nr:Ankyrin repeat and sterile alpha motif domain-containing protein 1B [Penaeus vannamei]
MPTHQDPTLSMTFTPVLSHPISLHDFATLTQRSLGRHINVYPKYRGQRVVGVGAESEFVNPPSGQNSDISQLKEQLFNDLPSSTSRERRPPETATNTIRRSGTKKRSAPQPPKTPRAQPTLDQQHSTDDLSHLSIRDPSQLVVGVPNTALTTTWRHHPNALVSSSVQYELATEIILTLGEAFEVAYQLALREQPYANQSDEQKLAHGHTRSKSEHLRGNKSLSNGSSHTRSHSTVPQQMSVGGVSSSSAENLLSDSGNGSEKENGSRRDSLSSKCVVVGGGRPGSSSDSEASPPPTPIVFEKDRGGLDSQSLPVLCLPNPLIQSIPTCPHPPIHSPPPPPQ